jgi:hypothetical protein
MTPAKSQNCDWQAGLEHSLALLERRAAALGRLDLPGKRQMQEICERQVWILISLQRFDEALLLLERQETLCRELGDVEALVENLEVQREIMIGLGRTVEEPPMAVAYAAAS